MTCGGQGGYQFSDLKDRLKNTPFDKLTDGEIKYLEKIGVINGVGPESYGWITRRIMTYLFGFIDYRRHDYSWFIGEDFHHSNRGLLKYSYISLAKEYKEICQKGFIKRILFKIKYYILLPIKTWIISLAFDAVESEVGENAYNNCLNHLNSYT